MTTDTTVLQQALTSSITSFTQTLGQVKDFTVAQLPEVIQQWLTFTFYTDIIYICIASFFLLCSFVLSASLWKKYKKVKEADALENDDYAIMSIISLALGLFIFMPIIISNTMEAVQIKVAPKVFIIQNVVNLVKGN